jgi:hypothetical protein
MLTVSDLALVPSDPPAPVTDQLRLAAAACLARFKGSAREHTESDLRCYLTWCAEHALDPLAAQRAPPGAVHPVDARDPPVQALHRGPILLNTRGARMDRHAATRRLRHRLAESYEYYMMLKPSLAPSPLAALPPKSAWYWANCPDTWHSATWVNMDL